MGSILPKTGVCGERLLPALIDELAVTAPSQVFARVPLEHHAQTKYRDVTISELANAINHASWWIEQNIGQSDDFTTLAYAGPQDLRIFSLIIAAVKTGHKLFLLSTGFQSTTTYLDLLEAFDCSIYLTPSQPLDITTEVMKQRSMKLYTVPELNDWLSPDVNKAPVYPYTKTWAEARTEPFVALHTSGSTGPPKPVILRHGSVTPSDLFLDLPKLGGRKLNLAAIQGSRMLFGFTLFHAAGITFMVFAIYANAAIVLSPVWPMTAASTDAVHTSGEVDGSLLGTSLLTELSKTPEYVENVRRLKYLTLGEHLYHGL